MDDDTNVTDHCRYHEHDVCDRWFRDICDCSCHRRPDCGKTLDRDR